MPVTLFFIFFTAVALLVIGTKTIAIAREGERVVVFRLGKLLYIYPAGWVLLVPFVDRAVTVSIDQIEGWQRMPESELEEKLVKAALEKSPPPGTNVGGA